MPRVRILLLSLLFAMESPAAPPPHRLLIIAAPSRDSPLYQQQAGELVAGWAGLMERDFLGRTQFGAAEFSVILIGKDGGEKLRRKSLLTTRELFAIVDAMPMRRAEMERGR